MASHPRLRRAVRLAALAAGVLGVVVAAVALRAYLTLRPLAITLGPETTLYFQEDPPLRVRVHEAIHRRQMRTKELPARIWSALRYNFDYRYRLDEEAEARAGEICLQIHRFGSNLPSYTSARSVAQARAYRAWAWERMGVEVPDRVGARLEGGDACHRILAGVELDLPSEEGLDEDEVLKLATFRYLQRYGSGDREVEAWKARLELAAYAEPSRWELPQDLPRFGLSAIARELDLPRDSAVDAAAAGRALHRVVYAAPGAERPRGVRRAGEPYPVAPDSLAAATADAVELELASWPRRLLERGLEGALAEDEVAALEALDRHPLHADLEVFARAARVDVVGTRYSDPLPATEARLPRTELDPLRTAFLLQWGRAALAAQRNGPAAARAVLRTVAAGALNLVENDPFEMGVLLGLEVLETALADLATLDGIRVQEARDAAQEAVTLPDDPPLLDTATAVDASPAWPGEPEPAPWVARWRALDRGDWIRGVRSALFAEDLDALHEALPALALDPGIPWAFRRAAYRQVALTDVCLELVVAPGDPGRHDAWRAAVDLGLVRHPSEARLLARVRQEVADLLRTADVPPWQVCSPGTGLHPGARTIIVEAAPWTLLLQGALGDR